MKMFWLLTWVNFKRELTRHALAVLRPGGLFMFAVIAYLVACDEHAGVAWFPVYWIAYIGVGLLTNLVIAMLLARRSKKYIKSLLKRAETIDA